MGDGVRRSKRLRSTSSQAPEANSPLQALNTPPRRPRARGRPRRAPAAVRPATSSIETTAVNEMPGKSLEADSVDEAAISVVTDESLDTHEELSTDEPGSSQQDAANNEPSASSKITTTVEVDVSDDFSPVDLIVVSDDIEEAVEETSVGDLMTSSETDFTHKDVNSIEDTSGTEPTTSLKEVITGGDISEDEDSSPASGTQDVTNPVEYNIVTEDGIEAETVVINETTRSTQEDHPEEMADITDFTEEVTILSDEEAPNDDTVMETNVHTPLIVEDDIDGSSLVHETPTNGSKKPFIYTCRSFAEIIDPQFRSTFEKFMSRLKPNQLETDVGARYIIRSLFESLTDAEKAELVIGHMMQISDLHSENETLRTELGQQDEEGNEGAGTWANLSRLLPYSQRETNDLSPISEVAEDSLISSPSTSLRKKPQGSRYFRRAFDSLFSRKRKQDSEGEEIEEADGELQSPDVGSASKRLKMTSVLSGSRGSSLDGDRPHNQLFHNIPRLPPNEPADAYTMSDGLFEVSDPTPHQSSRRLAYHNDDTAASEKMDSGEHVPSQSGTPSAPATSYLGSLLGSVSRIFTSGSQTAPPKVSNPTIPAVAQSSSNRLAATPKESKTFNLRNPDIAVPSIENIEADELIDYHSPTFLRQQRKPLLSAAPTSEPRQLDFFSAESRDTFKSELFAPQFNLYPRNNTSRDGESFLSRYSVPSSTSFGNDAPQSRYTTQASHTSGPTRGSSSSRPQHRLRNRDNNWHNSEKLKTAMATAHAFATKKIEDTQQVGQKRKTRTDDLRIIPSGPAGTFSMIDEFFEVDSSDEDDSTPLTVVEVADEERSSFKKRRAKQDSPVGTEMHSIRHRDVNSVPVFGSPSKQHTSSFEKSHAQPYEGKFFTDPVAPVYSGENIFALNKRMNDKVDELGKKTRDIERSSRFNNFEGTFSVPEDGDSDTSSIEVTETDSPSSSKAGYPSLGNLTPTATPIGFAANRVDNDANISPSKKSVNFASPIEMGPSTDYHGPIDSDSDRATDSADSHVAFGEGVLDVHKPGRSAGTSEDSQALAKIRSNAEKYKPKRPSALRAATGPSFAPGDTLGAGNLSNHTEELNSDESPESETTSGFNASSFVSKPAISQPAQMKENRLAALDGSTSAHDQMTISGSFNSVDSATTPPLEVNSPSSNSEDEFVWPEPGASLDTAFTKDEEDEWSKWAAVGSNLEDHWSQIMKTYENEVATGTEIDYGFQSAWAL